jgi:hypothetical protein
VRGVRVVTGAGIGAVSLLGHSLAAAEPAPDPPGFSTDALRIEVATSAPTPTTASGPPSQTTMPETTTTAVPKTTTTSTTTTTTTTTTTAPPNPTAAPVTRITGIGDSVMLGSEAALRATFGDILQIDAAVSRQFGDAVDVAGLLAAAGQLGERVIVHLGTNGIIRAEQLDALMQRLAAVPRVVVLNTDVPRPWEGPNNELLGRVVPNYPNAVLVDWKAISEPHAEWFIADGVHLTADGANNYAQAIAQHL